MSAATTTATTENENATDPKASKAADKRAKAVVSLLEKLGVTGGGELTPDRALTKLEKYLIRGKAPEGTLSTVEQKVLASLGYAPVEYENGETPADTEGGTSNSTDAETSNGDLGGLEGDQEADAAPETASGTTKKRKSATGKGKGGKTPQKAVSGAKAKTAGKVTDKATSKTKVDKNVGHSKKQESTTTGRKRDGSKTKFLVSMFKAQKEMPRAEAITRLHEEGGMTVGSANAYLAMACRPKDGSGVTREGNPAANPFGIQLKSFRSKDNVKMLKRV